MWKRGSVPGMLAISLLPYYLQKELTCGFAVTYISPWATASATCDVINGVYLHSAFLAVHSKRLNTTCNIHPFIHNLVQHVFVHIGHTVLFLRIYTTKDASVVSSILHKDTSTCGGSRTTDLLIGRHSSWATAISTIMLSAQLYLFQKILKCSKRKKCWRCIELPCPSSIRKSRPILVLLTSIYTFIVQWKPEV